MLNKNSIWNKRDHSKDPSPGVVVFPVADPEQVKFTKLVFAPDPETKNPCSDVSYMLTGTDEGFKQFVKQKLFQPGPEVPLAESADEALQFVKPNMVTEDQFLTYLNEYVRENAFVREEFLDE